MRNVNNVNLLINFFLSVIHFVYGRVTIAVVDLQPVFCALKIYFVFLVVNTQRKQPDLQAWCATVGKYLLCFINVFSENLMLKCGEIN